MGFFRQLAGGRSRPCSRRRHAATAAEGRGQRQLGSGTRLHGAPPARGRGSGLWVGVAPPGRQNRGGRSRPSDCTGHRRAQSDRCAGHQKVARLLARSQRAGRPRERGECPFDFGLSCGFRSMPPFSPQAMWNQSMLLSEDLVKASMAMMQKQKATFSKL